MNIDFTKVFLQIVEAAVLNKYPELDKSRVVAVFNITCTRIRRLSTEKSLTAELRKIRIPEDDVINQVTILYLLHRFWSKAPCLEFPLTTLNSASFGSIGRLKLRTSDSVPDYGGKVRTAKKGLTMRLNELERLCCHTVDLMEPCSVEAKALQLAYIHGALIRIHPFEDGNGRTARLFIQYALLKWKLVPTPLPKVRNNAAWALAMDQAVEGNAIALQQELLSRIRIANGL